MLDAIDIKILDLLQEEGRTKRGELAQAVGLSLPSLSERLRKLEEGGIIEGYHARVNKKSFGFDITAFIQILMESSRFYDKLIENVQKTPEIVECYSILGDGSHIFKIIVKNTAELEKLLRAIQAWPGVVRTVSSYVLSVIKESNKLNLINS